MKAGFLTLILKTQQAGFQKENVRQLAKTLGFKMYCHNGIVFSVENDDKLFQLSDLVDFKW